MVGLTLGAIAAVQAGRANQEATAARQAETVAEAETERAELNTRLARSRELLASAEATLDTDPSLAKLLAVASTQFAQPTADTTSILHRTFAADRVLARYAWPSGDLNGADLHPDGALIAVSGCDPTRLEVYDLEADELLWAWEGEEGMSVDEAHFTADGAHVLAGVVSESEGEKPTGGVHMWDSRSGELVRVVSPGRVSPRCDRRHQRARHSPPSHPVNAMGTAPLSESSIWSREIGPSWSQPPTGGR